MSRHAPSFEIVQHRPAEVRFKLPRRNLGKLRIFGYLLLICAIGLGSYGIAQLVGQPKLELADIMPLLFLPYVGTVLLLIACGLLFGRSEIQLDHQRMRAIERVGPFHWTFKRSTSSVVTLDIQPIISISNRPLTASHYVEAAGMYVAFGYPYETCYRVADSIRQHWPREQGHSSAAQLPAIIGGALSDFIDEDDSIIQPAGTKIEITDTPEQLSLQIPAAGIWKTSKGIFFFSLFWNGFMAIVTWGAVVGNEMKGPDLWVGWAVITLFWAIGIGLLLHAINRGRQSAAIVVGGEDLLIVQSGIFGLKRGQWNRRDIAAVLVAPSKLPHRDLPQMQLQIRLRARQIFNFLPGRNSDELRWLAAVIRRRLWPNREAAKLPGSY